MKEAIPMQTEKLFEQDVNLRTFEATVLSCEPHASHYRILLDRTAFFPEGGGQAADQGTAGDARVLDVHAQGSLIYHDTDPPARRGYAQWTTTGGWILRSSTAANTSCPASYTGCSATTT